MTTDSPEIISLRKKVQAATDEFNIAIALYQNWDICIVSENLHARLGRSYATGAFLVIRQALRREILLSLTRMWDTNPQSLSMVSIATLLKDPRVIDALAKKCANQWERSDTPSLDMMPEDQKGLVARLSKESEKEFGQARAELLRDNARRAIELIVDFDKGGKRSKTIEYLRTLRDQHLAHRQINPRNLDAKAHEEGNSEVEQIYFDSFALIRLINAVACGVDYNPDETAAMHLRHATFFWRGVLGERTAGHPDFVRHEG